MWGRTYLQLQRVHAVKRNQAADHALRLHAVLKDDPWNLRSLAGSWEPESLRYAKKLWDIGVAIGNLSQFGDHPVSL